ncbi:MAG: SCP2 sterol-binding domain-containing protein [Anaerolineales bacterium]|nr:SCP2 sterol-binding domain-containing protein [Anaerolineales bacterium]
MGYPFPSEAWLNALKDTLNRDERYAEIAKNWEGDMTVIIEPGERGDPESFPIAKYMDLWHGKCRSARVIDPSSEDLPDAAFTLRATIDNIYKIFTGDLDPMQAMLTRRLRVEGNMAHMLRNVPTVLEFVRCTRLVEIEDEH